MATREQEAQDLSAFINKQGNQLLRGVWQRQLRAEVRWIRDWEEWTVSVGSTQSKENDGQQEQ